jgi:hypothetical protein
MIAATEMAERPTQFYRIVESDPPTLWDFTSLKARGRDLLHPTPEALRIWDGIAVYETVEQAREQRRRYPKIGRFVAEVLVPLDAEIRCERTTRSDGHWTLWAPPEKLLALASVVPSV